jgi:hypothetical protein
VKIIKVFHGEQLIKLYDDNNDLLEEYIKPLHELLESSNIKILLTTSSALVIRPSKIDGILVLEKEKKNINDLDEDFIRDEE